MTEEQNRLREKQARERREFERVQREQYTKQLKTSILTGLENQTDAKKKVASGEEELICRPDSEDTVKMKPGSFSIF